MSAESRPIRDVLADQLADLDDSLGATVDDVQMLADLQQGIGRLLADDREVEGEIRKVLQERFDSGDLRKETYQLVKSMLDRFITEQVPTSPGNIVYSATEPPALQDDSEEAEHGRDDAFSSTTVLPHDTVTPQSADEQVQVGSVLRDRFLLQSRVSGGSMGVVYKALDRRLAEAGAENPYVAIKVLSPQLSKSGTALRALQQEAAKGRCLMHPNIVRFVDLDRDDDLYFIVMEWLEGRTLADILDSPDGKKIDVEQALDIVHRIGKALEYAHRCGIVHADVKPGNIMMAPNGDVKLFDFGVARVMQAQDRDAEPSIPGAVTPAYSSMQVLTGEDPVPADDVFSLGCLLYRLAAGYRVFGPRNAAEAAEAGMVPQRISALSDAQWAAVKKAISFPRVTRFDSVSEFLKALDDTSGALLNVEPDDRYVPQEESRSRLGLYVVLVLMLGMAGAGYYFRWDLPIRDFLEAEGIITSTDRGSGPSPPSAADTADGTPRVAADGSADGVADDGAAVFDDADPAIDDGTDPVLAVDQPGVDEADDVTGDPSTDVALLDYSTLPPADVDVTLVETTGESRPVVITLRENGPGVTVDLLRTDLLDLPLRLRLEEVAYTGNRSPWATGQYSISAPNVIEIPPRQDRARITLAMAADPLREADQLSTLRIRRSDTTQTQLAMLEVILEDDDQRAFEAGLPVNTVAFAVSQTSVNERDPAVQVDVLRFNPDDQSVIVGYYVRDITATEGEDYFAPSGFSLAFGPGQRSARLLIPLVQDSLIEGDEAFTVELAVRDEAAPADVFQRMVIMIRDDEIAPQ
ncbi:MAG: protein kinase [Woeseiaceae bacterium]|nr:protein kinase [Woeseiaceae bacterium]